MGVASLGGRVGNLVAPYTSFVVKNSITHTLSEILHYLPKSNN